MNQEPGSERVHPSRAEKSSMQIVPMHTYPFAPTAEELAGEEPPGDETVPHTERQACNRFAAPRAITLNNTPSKLSQHQDPPLADTSAHTTPQENARLPK